MTTRILIVLGLTLTACAGPRRPITVEYFGRCTEQTASGTPDIRDTERQEKRDQAVDDVAAFLQNFPSYRCVVMVVYRSE